MSDGGVDPPGSPNGGYVRGATPPGSPNGGRVGGARGNKHNLTLEIRVEDFGDIEDGKPRCSSTSVDAHNPLPPLSPSCSRSGLKERSGSMKSRKSAILHHFLHPLDYYHERKCRSSTSSINSDCGDLSDSTPSRSRSQTPEPPTGKSKNKSKTKLLSRPLTPNFFLTTPAWPTYKPPLRQRLSCPNPGGPSSPYPSPRGSPCVSPSPTHHYEFYKNAMRGSDLRFPDGHSAHNISLTSRSVSPDLILPKKNNNRLSVDGSSSHQDTRRERTRSNASCSSTGSSSGSSNYSSSSSDKSGSSSSDGSDADDDEPQEEKHKQRERKRYRDAARRPSAQSAPVRASTPPFKISLLSSDYKPPSPSGVSPVNKFLLSVMCQDPSGKPARQVGEKSKSYNVPEGDRAEGYLDEEVFDTHPDLDRTPSIHVGMESEKSRKESKEKRTSSVEKLYSVYEQIIREGQLVRRHSMEPERKRNGSGSTFGHTYLRGEDPNQAAIVFRDSRGLPAAAPFLENVKRSELEEDESQILVKFFRYHTTCDLIPTSAKLVIFDTRLQVKKAFYALVYNGVRAAPLWDSARQEFVGMLTITDFIRILQSFYSSPNRKMEELEEHRLEMWRTLLNDDVRKLISITPNECLYEAIRSLIHHKIHRLPVIDPFTGNVLYIITHKRILKFLYLYINELPKPSIMHKSLRELNIGTYENIETAKENTLIIEALNKFVERRISALPIVDDEGKLIDIYAKFDVINLAAEGTYHNLEVTLRDANEYRNEWFEGVLKCKLEETMETIMGRIVQAEVHRLVVVDNSNKVIGIVSLSDILNELVLKPCHDDPASLKVKTVAEMEATLNGEQRSDCSASGEEFNRGSSANLGPKTESEESVEKSWASGEGQGEGEDPKQDRPSSSTESIEEGKYNSTGLDVNKISETMCSEVGPISG